MSRGRSSSDDVLNLGVSDGGGRGPAKENLKHILGDIFFVFWRWRGSNSDDEGKGPRFRNDGVGCRGFEGFDNGVEERGCYVHNNNSLGS